jgi:hypothetical protein
MGMIWVIQKIARGVIKMLQIGIELGVSLSSGPIEDLFLGQ